jgi:hypothetical protein
MNVTVSWIHTRVFPNTLLPDALAEARAPCSRLVKGKNGCLRPTENCIHVDFLRSSARKWYVFGSMTVVQDVRFKRYTIANIRVDRFVKHTTRLREEGQEQQTRDFADVLCEICHLC